MYIILHFCFPASISGFTSVGRNSVNLQGFSWKAVMKAKSTSCSHKNFLPRECASVCVYVCVCSHQQWSSKEKYKQAVSHPAFKDSMNDLLYRENKGRMCLWKRRTENLGWSEGSGHRPISLASSFFQLDLISWTHTGMTRSPFLSYYFPAPNTVSATRGWCFKTAVIIMQYWKRTRHTEECKACDRMLWHHNAHDINNNFEQHQQCFLQNFLRLWRWGGVQFGSS